MLKLSTLPILLFYSLTISAKNINLLRKILTGKRLATVQARALQLLKRFTAGTSCGNVWIRDLNTFIGLLQVQPKEKVKDRRLLFFKMQGTDGNIADRMLANNGFYEWYDAILLLKNWAMHRK